MARTETRARGDAPPASGPIILVGLVAAIYGLSALLFARVGFSVSVGRGAAVGHRWVGLEVNGWTAVLFAAAGIGLVVGAVRGERGRPLVAAVGIAFVVAATIATLRGDGVFGVLAADGATDVTWLGAGVLLVCLALLLGPARRPVRPPPAFSVLEEGRRLR